MAELTYEVSFEGVASPTVRAAFVDCEVVTGTGSTSVRCRQGALRPVIARVEELGLELVDVRLVAAPEARGPDEPGRPPRSPGRG